MELLVGLVVLGALGLMVFGLFGAVFLGAISKRDRQLKASAPTTFDARFNGEPTVTYTVSGIAGPDYGAVVNGATKRGYRLTHDSGRDRYGSQTLVFERTSPRA